MTNIEKVVKALQDKKYTITHYPTRGYIEIEDVGYKKFYGSVVELSDSGFNPRLVFLSDNEGGYFHKWSMELDSEHLPPCVWLSRYSDPYLSIIDSFFI